MYQLGTVQSLKISVITLYLFELYMRTVVLYHCFVLLIYLFGLMPHQ